MCEGEREISPVVDMSAEVRINVVDIELAKSWSVESPGTVVTHHLLPTIRYLAGLGWVLGGLSGGVGGPGADLLLLQPVSQPVTELQGGTEARACRAGLTLTTRTV